MVSAEGFKAALALLDSEDPSSEAQLRELLETQMAENPQSQSVPLCEDEHFLS